MAAGMEVQFDDLFREVILDHYKRPRHHGELPAPTLRLEGMNPVCGDELELDLDVSDATIRDVRFRGRGCSISQASTSMLTECIAGRPVADALRVADAFRAMMMEGAPPTPELGDLEALQGVAKYPVRVKCALLGWNVLQQGLRPLVEGNHG
jgi:nitrogen fixation NifU-like protein